VPRCQVSRCPPLLHSLTLSSLAMSVPTILMVSQCQVLHFQSPPLTFKVYYLSNFCNPNILGLGCCQSWDSGIAKMAGIPGFGIPGLQSLVATWTRIQAWKFCDSSIIWSIKLIIPRDLQTEELSIRRCRSARLFADVD